MGTVSDSPGELREDIPLKSGTKSSNYCLCGGEDFFGSAKCINLSFGILSAIITLALLLQIYYGDFQVVPHGSVATDARECSEIGTSILKQGGNAVDAAIASAFCMAVVNPHVTGLDAEGQVMIYNHRNRLDPEVIDFPQNTNTKINEPLPRLVIGLAYIHQQYSKMSWRELILPSVYLARKGFLVSKMLSKAVKISNLQAVYGNLEPGQTIMMTKLAETLENFAEIAEDDLYNYITLENTPIKTSAIKNKFKHYNIYVPNAPSIGPELLSNLEQIEYLNVTHEDTNKVEFTYNLAKITQNTYKELNITTKYHQGQASNIAVIDKDDYYVSLITGLYNFFGSKVLSTAGYMLDVKDRSAKSCSRLPVIITDGEFICGRRLVTGFGNLATASQIIPTLLIAAENATEGIEAPRFNIYINKTLGIEDEHMPLFSDKDIKYLESLGNLVRLKEPYNSCNVVEKLGDFLSSHSDSRGGGIASRFR